MQLLASSLRQMGQLQQEAAASPHRGSDLDFLNLIKVWHVHTSY